MSTPYPRYNVLAERINTPGYVSAYDVDSSTGLPKGGIPSMGETPTTPTVNGERYGLGSESPVDKAQREHYEGLNKTQPDENVIRESIRKQMQGTIDAIDKEYASLFAQEDLNATDRLGQTRAANSRAGLLNSDFGIANAEKTVQLNASQKRALEAEKSLKIQSVFDKINTQTKEEVRAKKEEALGNTKSWMDYLARTQETVRDGIKTLAQGGVSLDELPVEQYQKLLKDSGYDEFTLKAAYNASKPANQKTNYQYEVKGNKIFAYGVNPQTGALEMLEKDLPAGAANTTGKFTEKLTADGTLLLVPEMIDPNKPIEDQIIMYGKEGQFKPTPKPTTTETTRALKTKAISQARPALEKSRNGGEFIDGNMYIQLRADYAEMIGDASEFDSAFAAMLSPNDRAKYGVGKATGVKAVPEEEEDDNPFE